MIKLNFPLLILILSVAYFANSANILLLAGIPSPSHHIWLRALALGLANQSEHNVTVLSANTEIKTPPNVHYIYLEKIYETLNNDNDAATAFNLTDIVMKQQTPFEEISTWGATFGARMCKGSFDNSNGMRTILNYPDSFKFDVVVHDFSSGPCLLFLMQKFKNPPLISVSAFLNPPYTTDLIGGHKYTAYIPFYNAKYDTNMNFFQRAYNTFLYAANFYYLNNERYPNQDEIVRKYIQWDFPYLGDIQQQTVLVLVNTHPSFDDPEPLPPNVIPVGGLQIEEPKPLPTDLEEFIDSAPKGAVLFSLGSNVKSNELGAETQIQFLNAFEQMPQYHFLWKFETDTLPMKLPKNVLIRSWLPQNDMLGHPKIKLFITHSGGLSTIEATWFGVPLVAIPFMADQHKNTFKSVKSGVAEKINFIGLTSEKVKETVLKVLETPSYREKMQLRSKRFRDQPEKPLNRAVWWIDYIIRNPKPNHIQSPAKKLGFIRSNCYDILAVLVTLILCVIYLVFKLVSYLRNNKTFKLKRN